MKGRWVAFGESLVILAILLALVQTFLEDFAVLAGWPLSRRDILLLAGFCFDLFFTVEFLLRLYSSFLDHMSYAYLSAGKGWIDFLASVPLLMLSSGPFFLSRLTGQAVFVGLGGMLYLLKVIKAIRVARVLRFLRVLKIFRGIQNVGSPMAQRHVAMVTTLAVSVLVFCLLAFSLIPSFPATVEHQKRAIAFLKSQENDLPAFARAVDYLREEEESLLLMKYQGKTVLSRYANGYYQENFAAGDYSYLRDGELELFFDLRPYAQQLSRENLLFFTAVLLTVLLFLILYGPHFALTVTDPIQVMRRGLAEKSYNFEVSIPTAYRDDDIFRLARLYNDRCLPLKDLNAGWEKKSVLDLGSAEVRELLEKEEG